MGAKGSVTLVGGRFSRHVAGMLGGYLSQLRSDVHSISPLPLESFDSLLDIGKSDPLIVFDYRRYPTDFVELRSDERRGGNASVGTCRDRWWTYIAKKKH